MRYAAADCGECWRVESPGTSTSRGQRATDESQVRAAVVGAVLLGRQSSHLRANQLTVPSGTQAATRRRGSTIAGRDVAHHPIELATRDSLAHRPADERSRMKTIVASTSADIAPLTARSATSALPVRETGSRLRSCRSIRTTAAAARKTCPRFQRRPGQGTPRRRRPHPGPPPAGEWMFCGSGESHEHQEHSGEWASPAARNHAHCQRTEHIGDNAVSN